MRAAPPGVTLLLLLGAVGCASTVHQGGVSTGQQAAEALEFSPLRPQPPAIETREVEGGVTVLLLEDHTLPLVDLYAWFRGGYAHFGRDHYAAGTAVPSLLRTGGTTSLSPDSVEALIEGLALETVFGGAAESSFSRLNTLSENLERAVSLWGDLLRNPLFDMAEVEVWRGQQIETVRRRNDDPGGLAVTEFNRLMYGDHPVGWNMTLDDLEQEDLARDRLRHIHRRIFCRENMIVGVSGDITWERMEELVVPLLADWPSCPEELPPPPDPNIRTGGGVFLIPKELNQSTVVMAHPGGIRLAPTREYFASRIGNSILGGAGFTSRLMSRIRSEEGYAYGASSLWTTPIRYQGIVGATTQTRGEKTVAATRLILEIMEELRDSPPTEDEVSTTVDEIANGFVFNFQDPAQIISRQVYYRAHGLPSDWMGIYLEGVQGVDAEAVGRVFRRYLHPEEMTILVVGNPELFEEPLESVGPVTVLKGRGGAGGAEAPTSARRTTSLPRGSPRSHR